MIKRTVILWLAIMSCLIAPAQKDARLRKGMTITQSTRFRTVTYYLQADSSFNSPLIRIQGNDIVLDFANTMLQGNKTGQSPDTYAGLAVLVENSRRVTIKNLRVRGYKVALMARQVDELVLENCDFSYNYRQHLNSTPEKEDLSDWMSYHQNEKDEWLRYGAAIYLKNCTQPVIRQCRVTGGQNALMMSNCNKAEVTGNDFSFNSGIGIGLYRSSYNLFAYNQVNFNVRGYSHGVYNRGQDSAGFLVYEQSSNNVFYKNSATHSGDGFFLWAGQSTMDNGQGGCNDNLLLENDFSYAPTNGIEVTFSRNNIVGNRVFECDHGIWGGYSYDSYIARNQFRDNRIAIAIEHGLQNNIQYNLFNQDREAIRLWARASQPADWAYAKLRDTRSAGNRIWKNSFNRISLAVNLARTDSTWLFANTYGEVASWLKQDSLTTRTDSIPDDPEAFTVAAPDVKPVTGVWGTQSRRAGRQHIRMTEWGPYDYRRPLIWRTNPADKGDTLRFDLLGPKGKWKVKQVKGLRILTARQGTFPATMTAVRLPAAGIDEEIILEYKGGKVITETGEDVAAGKTFSFSYRYFFQPVAWQVRWYCVDTARFNPIREEGLFPPNVRMRPVKTEATDQLNYAWWGGIKGEESCVQFLTLAEGEGRFAAGSYELAVTWDDAVRVYVDDKLVLDEWNPALYKFDESPNRRIKLQLNGLHKFRVEHIELGGFATLSLRFHRLY